MRLPPTLILALLRYLLRHPWQFGLAVLGVALGVAVVISIDLTQASARRAFDLSTQGALGNTTHRIIAGPNGLDEQLYVQLKRELAVRPATPVIEGEVQLPEHQNASLQVRGIDPITDLEFRSLTQSLPGTVQSLDISAFFLERGVFLSRETALRFGLQAGQRLLLQAGSVSSVVQVLALLDPVTAQDRAGMDDTLLMDISSAQEVLQLPGRLTHIDLIVPPGPQAQLTLDRISARLPPGSELVSATGRGQALQQMTQAFYLHLRALSLLALVVGVFLIYNTMSFIVVQQRRVLGMLRALGVTRGQVFAGTLLQAALLGLLGTLGGMLLGIGLAHALLGLVTRTINDIYFAVSVKEISYDALSLGKGFALGLLGSLLAAFWPAREAAGVTPRRSLLRSDQEQRFRRSARIAALAGISLCGVAGVLTWGTTHAMPLAFGILGALLLGAALLAPAATWILAQLARPILYRTLGLMGQYAARNVVASLSRTAVATAALVLAIATTTSIALMINSFRLAVDDWLQTLLRADYYLLANERGTVQGPLAADLVQRLRTLPAIVHLSTARHVTLEGGNGLTHLAAYEFAPESYAGFQFLEGDPKTAWLAFDKDEAVIVSEPYAYRHAVHPQQTITLHTDHGDHAFVVAGIFRDYSTEHGLVAMSRLTYNRYWQDRGYGSVGLYVQPGISTAELRQELAGLDPATRRFKLSSNRELRLASLAIFDRTFAITGVLRLLAGGIAFVGVLSALLALQLDRSRELAVLRACGLTPKQLTTAVLSETGLLGAIAGVLAMPLSLVMAAVLVFELNRHSFGWSMPLSIDAGTLLQGLLLALGAALLAGVFPAWRMAHTQPAQALRDE